MKGVPLYLNGFLAFPAPLCAKAALTARTAFTVGMVAAAPASGPGPDSVTAFVHVAVIPMDHERVLTDQVVIVRNGRITALGPTTKVAIPIGATLIDGQGKYLLPGLADMHVHIGHDATLDTTITADLLYAYLANGATTVRDMHSGGRAPRPSVHELPGAYHLELRRRLASGELFGPRLYLAGDPDISSPQAAAGSVAELKADGYDFVKISFTELGWRERYDSILAAARRVGLPVVGHVPALFDDITQLAKPWVSAEHLYEYMEYVLGLNGRWSSTEKGMLGMDLPAYADTAVWMRPGYQLDSVRLHRLVQGLRRNGIWSCPTLSTVDWEGKGTIPLDTTAMPPEGRKVFRVLLRYNTFNLQIVKALQAGGAGLLLGTDMIGNPFAIQHELALLVHRAGLTPYEALAMGTRNVAEFLGTQDSTGTIAVGKRADLVLLSGNPLEDIDYTAGPAGVMLGGRWLPRAELEAHLAAMHSMRSSPGADVQAFYTNVKNGIHNVWRH